MTDEPMSAAQVDDLLRRHPQPSLGVEEQIRILSGLQSGTVSPILHAWMPVQWEYLSDWTPAENWMARANELGADGWECFQLTWGVGVDDLFGWHAFWKRAVTETA